MSLHDNICLICGGEMVYNVPRLGANGGFVHKSTRQFLCENGKTENSFETTESIKAQLLAAQSKLSTLEGIIQKQKEALRVVVDCYGEDLARLDLQLCDEALSLTPETYVKEKEASTMADKPKEEL